jgi:hypothetical protein
MTHGSTCDGLDWFFVDLVFAADLARKAEHFVACNSRHGALSTSGFIYFGLTFFALEWRQSFENIPVRT